MTEFKRQFPRQKVQIEVELKFLDDTARTVITRNISEGGLFMRLYDADHYPLGEMVTLHFKDPLEDFEETTKDGIIVRQAEDGIAVAYVEIEGF